MTYLFRPVVNTPTAKDGGRHHPYGVVSNNIWPMTDGDLRALDFEIEPA